MGKPAARIGDMTAHGGAIVAGLPTVLIGKMPAARISDMHACPMVTPAPVPVPHVGLPIVLGSAGVMIGKMPAARLGDMATCTGPPDSITMGCVTVLIGETGGGSSGGGGGGFASAMAGAYEVLSGEPGPESKGPHWIEGQVVDSAGIPITEVGYELTDPDGNLTTGILTQDGVIKRGGFESDSDYNVKMYLVYNAKWSTEHAKIGDTVSLSADVEGFEDGTDAEIKIWEQDIGSPDDLMKKIETTVKGGKVEADWEYEFTDDYDDTTLDQSENGYSSPEYYFTVKVKDQETRSGLLLFKDYIEIKMVDDEGNPMANKDYILYLSNGEIRKGKLNSSGEAIEEDIPPGKCDIKFMKS